MLPIIRSKNAWPVHSRPSWNALNRLMDDFFSDVPTEVTALNNLGNIDVYEDEKHLYVDAELPGFNKDQISLVLEDGVLNLQAERKEDVKEDKKDNYYLRERSYGKWSRAIRLPVAVDEEKVEAGFENGVLKICMEKQEQKKSRKIQVK